jgi:hypothetical protein
MSLVEFGSDISLPLPPCPICWCSCAWQRLSRHTVIAMEQRAPTVPLEWLLRGETPPPEGCANKLMSIGSQVGFDWEQGLADPAQVVVAAGQRMWRQCLNMQGPHNPVVFSETTRSMVGLYSTDGEDLKRILRMRTILPREDTDFCGVMVKAFDNVQAAEPPSRSNHPDLFRLLEKLTPGLYPLTGPGYWLLEIHFTGQVHTLTGGGIYAQVEELRRHGRGHHITNNRCKRTLVHPHDVHLNALWYIPGWLGFAPELHIPQTQAGTQTGAFAQEPGFGNQQCAGILAGGAVTEPGSSSQSCARKLSSSEPHAGALTAAGAREPGFSSQTHVGALSQPHAGALIGAAAPEPGSCSQPHVGAQWAP